MLGGKRLRVYYMTQVQTSPPRFVLFVNGPELMLESYKKYMINQFREQYGFLGVPIVFDLRGKGQKPGEECVSMKSSAGPKNQLDVEGVNPDDMPDLQESLDSSYFS